MGVFATGVGKYLTYKDEGSSWGVAPGASAAQRLRRVSFESDLTIASTLSDEIIDDYQVNDHRLGMRKLSAMLKGRLSGKTFGDFIAAAVRQAWVAGPTLTAATLSSSASGPHFVRASGSFITDGWKVGMVMSPSGFSGAGTANNGKKFRITGVVALGLTVTNIDGSAATVAAETAGATVTFATPGKFAYVPSSGHTFKSFSFEELHSDVATPFAHLGLGYRVGSIDLSMQPDQNIGIDIGLTGKDRNKTNPAGAYFTSPTAATTNSLMNTVQGCLRLNGADVASMTDFKHKIDLGLDPASVLFAKTAPDQFPGRVVNTGSFAGYVKDTSIQDLFDAETEFALQYYMTGSLGAAGDVIAVAMPRVKLTSVKRNDVEKAIIESANFQALKYAAGTGIEQTTVWVQDTAMP